MPAKKAKKIEKRQESQKMVDFGTSISRFWNKYIDFNGVAQRSEYWFAALFLFLVEFLLKVFSFVPFFGAIHWLWSIAIFIPCLSITSRRLHDAGFSAKWLLALWIAALAGYVSLVLARFTILFLFVAEAAWIFSGVIGVFIFVVSLLPSKFKNNKYRK